MVLMLTSGVEAGLEKLLARSSGTAGRRRGVELFLGLLPLKRKPAGDRSSWGLELSLNSGLGASTGEWSAGVTTGGTACVTGAVVTREVTTDVLGAGVGVLVPRGGVLGGAAGAGEVLARGGVLGARPSAALGLGRRLVLAAACRG